MTTGGAEETIAVARSTAFNPQEVYEMAGFEWEDTRRQALICDDEPSTLMSKRAAHGFLEKAALI